ncbi:CLUMA_CG018606, isoform A [Clunio marinus]|uniref:CLUMA_CG018606, isoform A n=1 Tax=Clunio marinus TaxID=568069 RepID=A0A1J1IY71_9DIPT|nr:CLUMA_CG018606, isoform A [Clunio marinus]
MKSRNEFKKLQKGRKVINFKRLIKRHEMRQVYRVGAGEVSERARKKRKGFARECREGHQSSETSLNISSNV